MKASQIHPLIVQISVASSGQVTSHCYVTEVSFQARGGKKISLRGVCCVLFWRYNYRCLCNHRLHPLSASHLLNIHAPPFWTRPLTVRSDVSQSRAMRGEKNKQNTLSVFSLMHHCCLDTGQLHQWNVVICMTLGAASLISPRDNTVVIFFFGIQTRSPYSTAVYDSLVKRPLFLLEE